MSMMLADARGAAVARNRAVGACAGGFMEFQDSGEGQKLDLTSVLSMIAGLVAVLAVVRIVNLYFGGA